MNSTLRFLFLLLLGISYHTEDFCKILKPILHLSKMDEATDKEINSWITDNPDPQSNEVQTFEAPLQVTNPATLQSNEASPQTETKGQSKKKRQSKPSAATQRERRRASDTTYRGKMEGKWEELRRNVPGCSKDLSKEKNIDKIIDCIHILRQRSEEVKDENKNLKERLKHQSVSPQPNSSEYNELSNLLKEHDPVNISSLFVGNPQESNFGSGAESQLNAPEASRDASLQPQEAPRSHERETERFLNGNEDDEDEPCDSNGMSGYQSAMALSSKKRKQREELLSIFHYCSMLDSVIGGPARCYFWCFSWSCCSCLVFAHAHCSMFDACCSRFVGGPVPRVSG